MNMDVIMQAGVGLTVNELSDDECVALFLASSFGNINPNVKGYDKIKTLFTEGDGLMHSVTMDEFVTCLQRRVNNIV